MGVEETWKVLFQHLSGSGNGITVQYQGTMTKARMDMLLEVLVLTRNAMFEHVDTEIKSAEG